MTIKERSIKYTGYSEDIVDFDNEYHSCNCEGYDEHALAHAYADGATEQKKIDIDKACEWLRNNAMFFQNETTDFFDFDAMVAEFRKAMEQKNL